MEKKEDLILDDSNVEVKRANELGVKKYNY